MNTTALVPDKLEDISRKFGKLMAKAKSTDFPEEAENCVALAQKLLWESNLQETQLLSLSDIEKRAKRTFVKDGVSLGPGKYAINDIFNSRDWKSELLSSLADSFFCKLLDAYASDVAIVGEPKNVETVKSLYTYLEKQIRASRRTAFNLAKANNEIPYASKRYWSSSNKRNLSQFAVHSYKNSFASGAVGAIGRRLVEQQRENVEVADKMHKTTNLTAISYGAALVVQIHSELDEAFYEFFPELHPNAIALRRYQNEIAYQERLAENKRLQAFREERIAAGLEPEPEPQKPYKEYKRRGRRPQYRDTFNNQAFTHGRVAGTSIQINPAISGSKTSLNK